MAEGSMMELAVVIKAVDYFTGPLRSMVSQVTAADTKFKTISNTMKMMGKSKSEIDAINSSLQKMADQKAFANIASDLQKVGMARQDIAAMESSYMRMAQYQRDMAKAQESYAAGKDLAMSGVGNLTTAAVGGFGIFEMVKQAGEFQANMAVIQDSTGATNKQIQDFGDAVMTASAKVSKFSDFQMAQIAQTLTSGGFSNIKQAQGLLLPVAKYAESQIYEHKASDPIESTKQAIEMAHIFKNYNPKSFEGFLNDFNKYSLMQPGDSTQLEQTLKYLAPTALTMGMKPSDILSLSAVANRVGLSGSHGGTNAADMILRLIPGLIGGGPKPKLNSKGKIIGYTVPKAWQAMEDMGFIDSKGNSKFFNKNGSIKDLSGLLATMVADSKKFNPKDLMANYKDIFGIQGGRAASILAQPSSIEQLSQMQKQLGKTKSMEQINNHLQSTPEGQLNLLKSNSMTLMLRVGNQLAVMLNPAIQSINTFLGKMLEFSRLHPQVAKLVGDFALLMVGGKAVEGVFKIFAGNIKMVGAAFKMLKITSEAGELTKFGSILKGTGNVFKSFGSGALSVIKVLGGFGKTLLSLGTTALRWAIGVAADWLIAMGPVGWIIAGVTALIAAGVAAWMTNFFGFRDKMTALWNWIKGHWKQLAIAAINPIGTIFELALALLPAKFKQSGIDMMKGLMNGIKSMLGSVGNTIKSIGSSISNTFKSILGIHSPSKVFMEHGKFIVQGLSMGIDQNTKLANRSTANLAQGLSGSFHHGNGLTLAGGNGNIEIHIHPHPNQRAEDIADMVMKKLGKSSRRMMMNAGTTVNMGAM